MCVICSDAMHLDEERLALRCGHAFHAECVNRYARCKGMPLEEACPMRCHLSIPAADDGLQSNQVLINLVNDAEDASGALL